MHSNAFEEDANRGQTMGSFGVSDVFISIHFVLCFPILRFISFSTSIIANEHAYIGVGLLLGSYSEME